MQFALGLCGSARLTGSNLHMFGQRSLDCLEWVWLGTISVNVIGPKIWTLGKCLAQIELVAILEKDYRVDKKKIIRLLC